MEEPRATLDILSDPICPWCYIGKAKLDRALAQRPDHGLDIFWRPYQLNPDMAPEGMDRTEYLETKFGGPERAKTIYGQIRDAAGAAGLKVDFDAIKRTPNTFDAHRLIRWARSGGHQQAAMDSLFIRYFERGEDIGDRAILMDVAREVGMDLDLLARLYDEDADRELLTNEEALARQMGVNGVPTFILSEKFALVGAQETEAWLDVLDRLAKDAGQTE
jgi:predicted DsbA family dithiol-disulfide isomerase